MTARHDLPGVVIDLGEEHGTVDERPGTARRPRRWRRALARWPVPVWLGRWRVAALAACLLLAGVAGGGGRWPGPPLRLVARVPVADGSSVMVDDGRLMVLGYGQALTAYAVRDGARLWRAPLDVPTGFGSMTVSDGVVLVSRYQNAGGDVATEAVDEVTGRVLWDSPSTVFVLLPGTGTVLLSADTAPAALRLVDLRTGATRWNRPIEGCQLSLDRPPPSVPDAFALLCAGGDIDVIDLATGAARSTWPSAGSPSGPNAQLVTVGPVVVAERSDGAGSTIVEAYRWRDGARIWARHGPLPQDIYPCAGGDVCVWADTTGLVLDPLSGTPLPVPVPPDPYTPHAATIFVLDPHNHPPTMLLVPMGRAVSGSPPAYVVPAAPAATSVVLQHFPSIHPLFGDTPVAALASYTEPHGIVQVEIVDATGAVRPLQQVNGVTPSICTATLTYLICPTAGDLATVWQFPTD